MITSNGIGLYMATTKISVIVPVYKTEQYLDKCMQSVLHGSFGEIEVILIDDGSPNGVECEKYAAEDARVRVLRHEANKGLSAARNEGVRQAKSPYITFIDSDDWAKPSMMDDMYQLAMKHDAGIVSCGFIEYIGEKPRKDRNLTDETVMEGREAVRLSLLSEPAASHTACGKLYKRELFEGVEYPEGRIYEDAATTYLLYHKAKTVVHTKKQFYCYTMNSEGLTKSGFNPSSMDKLAAADEIICFVREAYPEYLNHAYCFKTVAAMRIAAKLTPKARKSYPDEYSIIKKIILSSGSEANRLLSNRHRVLLLLFKYCRPAFLYVWKRRLQAV